MKNSRYLALSWLTVGLFSSTLMANQEFDPDEVLKNRVELDKAAYLEYLNYAQKVYSSGEDFELGEKTEFGTAFKFHPDEDQFVRLRLNIDPKRNVSENKTSDVEVILNHRFDGVELQVDLNLRFDDEGRGATTLGPDTDSDYSFMAYEFAEDFKFIFYPYNFAGDVGRVFFTNDVTSIFYIEGTPDFITNLPLRNERIRFKTLPGVELQYQWTPSSQLYVGAAAGRYIYPGQDDFSIEENVAATRWRTKSDLGVKAGYVFRNEDRKLRLEYVSHDKASETGSLLETAASLQWEEKLGASFEVYAEASYSKAGSQAYNLDLATGWFAETTPFRPIYSDFYGEKQNWLGENDTAYYAKVSYISGSHAPYLSFKAIGENFVYFEEESAHRLRTNDLTESHGGVNIFGLGWQIRKGRYTFTPEIEYKVAANKVFGNRLDLREDRELEELSRRASSFTFYTTYAL